MIPKTFFLKTFFLLLAFLYSGSIYAAEINYENVIDSSSIFLPENVSIWETILLDIKDINTRLSEITNNGEEFYYRWDIYNRSPVEETTTEIQFDTYWEKKVSLNIFNNKQDQTLLHSKDFTIFVYQSSIPVLLSDKINKRDIDFFNKNAKNLWVYLYKIWIYSEYELNGKNIISELDIYRNSSKNISNYLHIWWEKEFLLTAISQIWTQSENIDTKNFVLTSSYNAKILQWYLWNSLAGKEFIDTAFIIDESTSQRILNNPSNIDDLLNDLEANDYVYTSISNDVEISPFLFISKFINSLSQSWVSTSDLYIILLLPLFLTSVAVAKHFVWLSTLWSVIPVFISILFIKIWIPFTVLLMVLLIISNILIWLFFNKYTLLYTPKVACMTIMNIVIFMLSYQLWINFWVIQSPIDNILYVIIFFIIAEKLITIITSKEFREYKKSLSGTLVVSLLCTLMYFSDFIVVFLTAYPEILLVLIPFNFFLWRFTGLRITEYLRFREIVKSVEE